MNAIIRYLSAVLVFSSFSLLLISCGRDNVKSEIQEIKKWEKITLSFKGPETSETDTKNPFLNYRLIVRFTKDGTTYSIPGFYAADGRASETSADAGNIWQVRFRPPEEGTWSYTVEFREGENIAVSDDGQAGNPIAFDGTTGKINVLPNPDHKGRLIKTGGRYLKYADSDDHFLKGGADSPENFLAYHEFDGTYRGKDPEERSGEATANEELHKYEAHIADWKKGNPTWQNGKGKGIIGALNYLSSKGMNSVYFLTMNIEGDGKDVWPYTGYDERVRFDCSKLDQWEIVFDHMNHLGLMLHFVTQETENEKLLDEGNTELHRKLYYRELIARFAHHPAVTWNLGEENGPMHFSPNGQNTRQQKDMATYLKTHDPYKNFLVIHSHHNDSSKHALYTPLLGFPHLDGMSIQNGNPHHTHRVTKEWLQKSQAAGKPWIMCMDELGPANRGIDPDDREDNNQDEMRSAVLWANLMAGGAGVEWYFGYLNHNNDLGCEDWRSRDQVWDFTRIALEFFQNEIPYTEMESHDQLLDCDNRNFCFAKPGEVYVVYYSKFTNCGLDLSGTEGEYTVQWFNPRDGSMATGSRSSVSGGAKIDVGDPPGDTDRDWTVLLRKK